MVWVIKTGDDERDAKYGPAERPEYLQDWFISVVTGAIYDSEWTWDQRMAYRFHDRGRAVQVCSTDGIDKGRVMRLRRKA